ncbi:L-Ala-D/L-Glu epimerase [Bacteroidales bacterium Barb6]|nr:L-Ala-D/L-Glu epimerase [Bacteroidales bacterium Barb6]
MLYDTPPFPPAYLRTTVICNCLTFRQPAGTSRGIYTTRKVWYVLLTSEQQPAQWGIGECAPLPNLSPDDLPDYEQILKRTCRQLETSGTLDTEVLRAYPSILFGLETALRHFQARTFALWDTPFSRGQAGIPINGLIWMGDSQTMLQQIKEKTAAGFRCLKLKIGAIDFEEEFNLIRQIRKHYPPEEMEIRADANGAFHPAEALSKLSRLAELGIHSVEQPIRPGQWQAMAELAARSPLPIALDEELIGIRTPDEKRRLLQTIRPPYIILKPTLHGGITGCTEWIEEACKLHINWWITSALESNIGLNAIAQWCATLQNPLPQGLGTGALFTANVPLPLTVRKDRLWYDRVGEKPLFLSEWLDDSPFISLQTSGSTGTPKQITVRKQQMTQSALATISYLRLRRGDKALLCLPLQYIAGKMMLVRTLVAGLDLTMTTPSAHPLANIDTPLHFAAMPPAQIYATLQIPEEKERLKQIKILLIGGSPIDPQTEQELSTFPHAVYATYGMTETLSHIALRRLNGSQASPLYTPLPSVTLTLSADNTLVINAPYISDTPVCTNDIARLLPDGRFLILGRKDNIINSGSLKIHPEEIENALSPLIPTSFAVTSIPHPQWGEALVLLISSDTPCDIPALQTRINRILPTHHRPKHIYIVKEIPLTETSKPDRPACKKIALTYSIPLL